MPEEIVVDWKASDYLMEERFDKLADRRIVLRSKQRAIEQELKELHMEMAVMLATADVKSVRYDNWRFSLGHSMKGGKLSRELLIEAGVSVDQLERGTTPRELGDPFVSLNEIKES